MGKIEINMDNLDKFKADFLDNQINKMLEQQNKDIEDEVIRFLRLNAYKPRRTVKYMESLKKRLEKQGLRLVVDKINEQIDYEGSTYTHKYYIVPRFEKIIKE